MEQVQNRSTLEDKFIVLCSEVLKDLNLEVYDLEYLSSNSVLRIYVQDPKTKSAVIEDCIKVDQALTEHIENLDWMPEELTLEVSSPGMFREIKSRKHFEAAVGENVDFILFKRLDEIVGGEDLPKRLNKQKKIRAIVAAVNDEAVTIAEDNKNFKIEFELIKTAKLSPPWN